MTTYYVNKSGSAGNSGLSEGAAKLTIAQGIALMSGGDRLLIGDGTYVEQVGAGDGGGSSLIPSGSSGSPTIIQAQNTRGVVVAPNAGGNFYAIEIKDCSYITIDGIIADATNVQSYPYLAHGTTSAQIHHIIFQNGTARNGQGDFATGVAFGDPSSKVQYGQVLNMYCHDNGLPSFISLGITLGGNNCIIRGNYCYNNGSYGIQCYRNATDNLIERNRIYSNANRGFIFAVSEAVTTGTRDNLFINNLIYNNGRGLEVDGDCVNNLIANNVIYNNTHNAIWLQGGSTIVKNNIGWLNSTDAIVEDGGTGIGVTDGHNLMGTNPLFVDPGNGDFHLQAGSPAIDAGLDLSASFITDFDGNVRV